MFAVRSFTRGALTSRAYKEAAVPLVWRNVASLSYKAKAADVKDLRERTGSPMMECKKALEDPEVEGDMDLALDWLRKRGAAAAQKKADREANEGLVAVSIGTNNQSGALVELTSETDFVSRNEEFHVFLSKLSETALGMQKSTSEFASLNISGLEEGRSDVNTAVTDIAGKLRENISLRRFAKVSIPEGVQGAIGGYVHSKVTPDSNAGTIGCLVGLTYEGELADQTPVVELANKLAMHVAAANPLFINTASVDPDYIEKEENILREKFTLAEMSKGKEIEASVLEKRVNKKVGKAKKKVLEEIAFSEQPFMLGIHGKSSVQQVINNTTKELKGVKSIKLATFKRFQIGTAVPENGAPSSICSTVDIISA